MAMVKRTISITPHNDAWIKLRVANGDYASDSEYLRDLIRHDREKHGELEAIRAALIEGEESGISNRTPDVIFEAVMTRKRENGGL